MPKELVVVTDLDGTLLDHDNYSYAAALPALRELERRGIPLVFNSSKTAREILELRRALGNREPFVVENGAGIYAPVGGGGGDVEAFERIPLAGMKRAGVLEAARGLRGALGYRFRGFADMNPAQLAACTGLSLPEAERALARDFTEPVLWEDSEQRLEEFREGLRAKGILTVRGGRFLHLSGPVDKGRAIAWLKAWYGGGAAVPRVVALGDSDNDRAMLEASDIPVLVRSPVRPPPEVNHRALQVTKEKGPAGWNQAVLALLDGLRAEKR